MTAGVVLAAGESRRLGRCKATLPAGSSHLLGITLDALLGAQLSPVVVVAGRYRDEIERATTPWPVEVVENRRWRQGQITSLQCGLESIGREQPVIVALVDHPGFSEGLVREMIDVYEREKVAGVIPAYRGQPGHPVLFGPEMIERLVALGPDRSARDVVQAFGERVRLLKTDEEAVIRDIDTEEDYRQYLLARGVSEIE